jgi:hypothetical protein
VSDLVYIRVRDDATGYMAPYAGQIVGDPMRRWEAEEVCRAAANGAQWELIAVDEVAS